jgi:uncharacterized protein with FMN-binding domain
MYGQVGGADETETIDTSLAGIIEPWRGVWYSHYGQRRLDGYTIGRWSEIETLLGNKLALFPDFDPSDPHLYDDYAIADDDYFIFYDDTVYETTPGDGGNGGWEGLVTRYIGIVRAVNIFNDNAKTGAVIIEYLNGCFPQWSTDVLLMPLPFFGMYYRVLTSDCIQMANAVDLAALAANKRYYTETATLAEAIAKNSAENDGEFISWGVVIPQDREKAPSRYTPGTYTGSAISYGGTLVLSVDFSADAITGVTITEHHDSIGRRAVQSALEQIPAAIVNQQSLDVDVVSGATVTSRRIMDAVKDCVLQAGGN